MADNMLTGSACQQAHTVLTQLHAAKMTRRAEQDRVTKALAEKDPDATVILPATVSEQDGCTKPGTGESMSFMMRMCRDQVSRKKYFAHVWPCLKIRTLWRLAGCRFGHGSMRMITNSLEVAQRVTRRCPEPSATSHEEQGHQGSGQHRAG